MKAKGKKRRPVQVRPLTHVPLEAYRVMFESNPLPMWVFDSETLSFLEVNGAAVKHYGYSRGEFLSMTIKDIRPTGDVARLMEDLAQHHKGLDVAGQWKHKKKDGTVIDVEIRSHELEFAGKKAKLVLAHDITEQTLMEEALRRSKRDLSLVYDNVSDIIFYLGVEADSRFRFLSVNRAFSKATGLREEEAVGKLVQEVIPEPSLAVVLAKYREAIRGKTTVKWEETSVYPAGTKYGEVSVTPIYDAEGHCTNLIGAVHDVTEQKRLETERQAVQERELFLAEAGALLGSSLEYRQVLANLARLAVPRIADWCAVDILEEDGSLHRLAVEHVDAKKVAMAFEMQARYPSRPEEGGGVYKVIKTGEPEFYPEVPEELLIAAAQDEEHLRLIREMAIRSAIVVPLKIHEKVQGVLTMVYAESGKLYGESDLRFAEEIARRAALAIENSRLYSETQVLNKELERRVMERTADLQTVNKELETFSYSVSHDLRAPLRHIDGFADMLMKHAQGTLDAAATRYVKTISDSAKEMGILIDELLVFSRMGRVEVRSTNVNLEALVRETIKNLNTETVSRTIDWNIESLPEVEADPSMLRLVLQNLIANSIKYTRQRNPAYIHIGSRQGTDETVFYIRDNGVGFDMQYSGKLFGVFQRLHAAAEFEGTGIGLANVRRIIERHGGKTWAEGEIEKGATFYFSLPHHRKG